jgi:hypothetical protein
MGGRGSILRAHPEHPRRIGRFDGEESPHPVLGSAKVYEVAYWKLYDAVACLLPTRTAGAEAAGAARKLASSLSITRWPRYVPLPTEHRVPSYWEDKTAS